MKNEVPIVFALDNQYALTTGVALYTLLKYTDNPKQYRIFFLVPEDFLQAHREKLEYIAAEFENTNICWINMHQLFWDATLSIAHISVQTYYRLKLPDILTGYDKCIYLDSDILVLRDLAPLYAYELDRNYVGGVKAPGYLLREDGSEYSKRLGIRDMSEYINAGVLLMNLKQMRSDGIVSKFMDKMDCNFECQDQDILNAVCYGHIMHLPFLYNTYVGKIGERNAILEKVFPKQEVWEAKNNPAIIHFAAKDTKPWKEEHIFYADLWWDIAAKTPYRDQLVSLKGEMAEWKEARSREYVERILNKKKNIVLFGFSEIGRIVYDKLEKMGYSKKIIFYCDNDGKKIGLAYHGVKVEKLENILEADKEAYFFVTSQRYGKEIRDQLVKMNVKEQNIYLYTNIDPLLETALKDPDYMKLYF